MLPPADRESSVLLAVSIDDPEKIQLMIDRIVKEGGPEPDYTFLSDPGHRVIGRYGLLNPGGRGWSHPATYVIDREGIVRWKFIEVNYRIRPTNEMIAAAVAALRSR